MFTSKFSFGAAAVVECCTAHSFSLSNRIVINQMRFWLVGFRVESVGFGVWGLGFRDQKCGNTKVRVSARSVSRCMMLHAMGFCCDACNMRRLYYIVHDIAFREASKRVKGREDTG